MKHNDRVAYILSKLPGFQSRSEMTAFLMQVAERDDKVTSDPRVIAARAKREQEIRRKQK